MGKEAEEEEESEREWEVGCCIACEEMGIELNVIGCVSFYVSISNDFLRFDMRNYENHEMIDVKCCWKIKVEIKST